jgi:hypothetical protein
MFTWLSNSVADVRVLRENWGSVRGGWRAARQDALELVMHRRILVNSHAMTANGMQIVLRTRIRLNGDTETDILRNWLDTVTPPALEASAGAHFRSVAAAVAGFAAAVSMERLVVRAALLIGFALSAIASLRSLLQTEPSRRIGALLDDWILWAALALVLGGILLRVILRWRMRAIFCRNSPGSPTRSRAFSFR